MRYIRLIRGAELFTIITDTSANLDRRWLEEHGVAAIPFHYLVKGKDCTCLDTEHFDGASFYGAMREGERVTTSQITCGARGGSPPNQITSKTIR